MIEFKHISRLLMLSAALAGCQRMDDIQNEPVCPDTFTATMESCEPVTRTALTDIDGIQYSKWTSGDAIAVFQGGSDISKYILDGTSEGTFRPDGISAGQTDFPANIAVYPYNAEIKVKETNINNYTLSNIVFPDEQEYAANSFAEESFVMAAVTSGVEDRALIFKNICGGLRLQLKGAKEVKVTSIVFKGNNDEVIAGQGTVSYVKSANGNDIPRFESITSEAKSTITLDCPDVQLDETASTEFIISIPPVDFSNGFTVTVNAEVAGNDCSYVCTSDKFHRISRSRILTMPEISFGEGDYIDEFGVNHGQGVRIGETVWAPVNCGYHATDFKYGKLYQWGRKYGQGYKGEISDVNGSAVGDYSDASVPEIVAGPVSLSEGQSKSNANKFYTSSSDYYYDWCSSQDDILWNSATEENPLKTDYDPCPAGWRVPTYAELEELSENYSSWTTDENGQSGLWLSGPESYSSSVSQVFFPAAGCRYGSGSGADGRGNIGVYWSSGPDNSYACYLSFRSDYVRMGSGLGRADGYSVRCVQE